MQRNLFVVMRLGSPVVLSYLDAGFEPRCGRKDFSCVCLLAGAAAAAVAAKTCCSPLDPKRWCKTSTVMKSRLELGPSWVLVLRNAWDLTVEERPLALEICLHGYDDCPETRLKTAHFHLKMDHRVAPRRGTRLIEQPFAIL